MLLLAAVVAGIVVAGARPALACSCAPAPPPETALSEADAVFVGEATALSEADAGATRVARLAVTEVFVGDVPEEVEVRTPAGSAACGYGFEPGRADLVYAVLDADGVLNTNLCDRTAPLSEAEGDLAAFGAGSEPARGGGAADDPTDPDEVGVPDDPDVALPEEAVAGDEADGAATGLRLAALALAIAAVIAVTVGVQRRRRT